MRTFTVYDPVTGEITLVQTDRGNHMTVETLRGAGLSAVEGGSDMARQWVDIGQDPPAIADRPSLTGFDKLAIAADGVDTAVLAGLPTPCTVMVDGQPYTVEDGELWIRSTTAASYAVEVDAFPYLPYRAEVTAS